MVRIKQTLSEASTQADLDAVEDIIHLSTAGRDIIVLSSPKYIHKLLNNGAFIYSDRPILPMINKLVDFDQGVIMNQEGK